MINPLTGRTISEKGKIFVGIRETCERIEQSEGAGAVKNRQEEEEEEEVVSSKKLLSRVSDFLREAKESTHHNGQKMSDDVYSRLQSHIRHTLSSYEKDSALPLKRTVEDHLDYMMSLFGSESNKRTDKEIEDDREREDAVSVPYADIDRSLTLRKLSIANCHDGQRKLTMALLEFVSQAILRLQCAPSDLLVVYAGASGLASAITSSVFPGLKMVLYDPAPNTLSHMPVSYENKRIITTSPFSSYSA